MTKKIDQFEELIADTKGMHSKRLNALLVTMEDEDFAVNYFKMLEYASPKLTRREVIQEEKEQEIKIVHVFKDEGTAKEVENGLGNDD